jgi:hypothetical protein
MARTCDKRQQITAALTRVRIQLQDQILLLRRNLNVAQHILESVRNHSWEWMSVAAGFGWLLSRLPTRKEKIYIHSSIPEELKSSRNGPLGQLWKAAWVISKPLIAAYLAKKLAKKANIPGSKRSVEHG